MKRRGFALFLAAVMLFAQTAPAAAMEEGTLLSDETEYGAEEALADWLPSGEEGLLSEAETEGEAELELFPAAEGVFEEASVPGMDGEIEGILSGPEDVENLEDGFSSVLAEADPAENEAEADSAPAWTEEDFVFDDFGAGESDLYPEDYPEDGFAPDQEEVFAGEAALFAEDVFFEEEAASGEDMFFEEEEVSGEAALSEEEAFPIEEVVPAEEALFEDESEDESGWLLTAEEEADEEDAEFLNAAGDREENYSVWIEDDGETDRYRDGGFLVYSNEPDYRLRLNTEELAGLEDPYTISWLVGHADEDGFYMTLTEGEGFTIEEDGEVIVLDGTSLQYSQKDGTDGLDLYAAVLVGNDVVAECGAWLRVWDPREDYQFQMGDWIALPGWGRGIDRSFNCYVDDAEHPYGEDIEVEVTQAELELLDETEEGAITLEPWEDGNGWHIQANEFGHARITLYYTAWDGSDVQDPYAFDVWVGGDAYSVHMDSTGGERHALPGGSIELYADASHEYFDENGDYQDDADGLDYEWGFEYGEEFAEIEVHEDDRSRATLWFFDLPEGWDSIGEEVRVYVKILDADGNETEGYDATTFRVESEYLELWPLSLDQTLEVGASIEDQAFEVRRYVQGQDSYEVLGDGDGLQIHYEWEYDENAVEITRRVEGEVEPVVIANGEICSGNIFSIRRKMDWDTWVNVKAWWEDEDSNYREVRGEYHFFGLNTDIWFDEHDLDIYTDDADPEQLWLNTENLGEDWQDRLDAELTVGCWDGEADDWAYMLSEGSDYTAAAEDDGSGIAVALTDEYLASLTEDEDVRVTAEIYLKDVDRTDENRLSDADAWFHLRTPRYDYDREWDRTMLPGWDGTVDGTYDVYVENAEYPDGWDTQYRVTNVEVIADDPWDGEDGSVITDFHIDYEDGDETSENYWWYYRVEHCGEATLRVTYETVTGETDSYEFTLFVGGNVYSVYMDSTGGERHVLPGGSIELFADASHEYFDENGDYQDDADGLGYEWGFEYGEEFAEIEVHADDPSKATLRFFDLPEGWDSIGEDVRVYVKILDADGNETEGYDATTFWVESDYLELWPLTLDPALEVGASFTDQVFEVRRYVQGQDGYEVLDEDDRFNVSYEWHYDENAMVVTGRVEGEVEPAVIADGDAGSGNVFTITRKGDWHTDFSVRAFWYDENGEEQDIWGNYHLDSLDCDIWFEEHDLDIYTDDTDPEQLWLNTENLGEDWQDRLDAVLTVGVWNDEADVWAYTLSEGSDYTAAAEDDGSGIAVALTDEYLASLTEDEDVRVTAEIYLKGADRTDENLVSDTDAWFHLRTPRCEYDREWDRTMLPGWDGTVDGTYDVYVENAEYPDGWDTQYRVTDVEVIADDPWDGEDGSVITDFHIDYEDGDETSEYYWWYYRVEHCGEATLRVTYETVTGETDSYEFTLFVGGDVYSVYMDSIGGERHALPGGSIELYADASHEYIDENGDYQDDADGLGYEWGFEYGEEFAVIEVHADDPSKATLRFNELPEGWDSIGEDVRVYVKILDADGNETEGYDATTFWVESDYLELWPLTLDPALEVGASIVDQAFEVRRYVQGQDGYEVLDEDDRFNVSYEWHYDENAMEVSELTEGAAQPAVIADGDTGSGNVFTITRKGEWDTDFSVRAYWNDENDEGQDVWGNYRFDSLNYDIWFEDLRDGDGLSHVYTDETLDLRLNTENLSGRNGIEIRWSVGEADEDGNFITELTPGTDGYTVDADGCGITVDGSVLKDHLVPDTDGVNVRAEVYVNGILLDEDEWLWLRVWDPRTEDGPRDEQMFVEDRRTIWYDDGSHIKVWNKEHPHGDWLRYTVEEILGIDSEEDEYDSRPVAEVIEEGIDDDGNPWWDLRAVRNGEARITLRLGLWEEENGQRMDHVGDIEVTVSWWVGSFHADLDITTSTGSNVMVPGNEIILTPHLNAREQDPFTGQIRDVDPSRFEICWEDVWTDEWFDDVDESSDDFSCGWNWEALEDGTLKITTDAGAPQQRLCVRVAAYDHDDQDPERRWEICSREFDLELWQEIFQVDLAEDPAGAYGAWDADLPAGLSQTILPVVRLIRSGREPEDVTENVFYRLDWYEEDPAQENAFTDFTITDADGKVLSHYEDGGDGCIGRPPFTIVRHGNWPMNLEILACGTDAQSGDEFEYGRIRLRTNDVNFPVELISSSGRGGESETWFYVNEADIRVEPSASEALVQLMQEYPGEVDVELSWGIWEYDQPSDSFVLRPWKNYDEEGQETGDDFSFEPGEWSDETGLNLAGTSTERREEILRILNMNDRGGFEIRAVVRCAGEMLDERMMHVELKWNEERLEDDDAATIRGQDFYYTDGHAELYIEDTEHCGGNDRDDRPGTYYDVTIVHIAVTGGDENCLRPEHGSDGSWYIRAEQEGSAEITYTYTGGPAGNGTATHTTWLHVVPEAYSLVFEDTAGNMRDYMTLLPGETAPAGAVVYRRVFNREKAQAGEEDPYDLERVSDTLLVFEYRDYSGYTIEIDETDGMIRALHTGDTDVRVGVHVHGKVDGQLREVWYTEETLHVHVDVREGLLDLSGETIYLIPGQEISIPEIEDRIAGHFSIRSLAVPEGAPAQAEKVWFDNIYGRTQTYGLALSVDPDGSGKYRVLKVSEHVLEEAAARGELSPDGTYRAQVWTCVHDADRVFAGDDLKVVVHEHSWDAGTVTTQPSCTQTGVRRHTCGICGQTKEVTVAALGHKEDAGTVTAVPSCKKEGTRTFKCTRCGKVLRTAAIPKTAHTPVTDPAVAAGCESTGKSAGSHCSVCGQVLKAQTVIPAKGHTPAADAAVPVTCETDGKTAGSHCSVCGKVLTAQTVIKAAGHKWDAGNVTKEPTVSAEGIRTYTCSVCRKTRTEAIPKLTAAEADKKAEGDSSDPSSVAGAEKAMTQVKDNAEPKDSSFALIQLQSKKQTKTSITISWNKVKGASGYIVYGNMCGKKNQLMRLSKQKKTSFVYKNLKKGTYYKFTVVAYKTAEGKQTIIGSSKTIHVATPGGKVTNVSKIQAVVKKKTVTKLNLKAKKTATISSKQTLANKKLKLSKHRAVKYESSDPKVASVNAKGKVTAKKKGTCIIYVYSQSGTFAKVKLTVK